MRFLPEDGYKRILVLAFYAVLGIILIYIFFKYLLDLLLPFIIAWLVALAIRPIAESVSKRTGISKKVASVILVILLLALMGGVLFYILDKLIFEFSGIVKTVNDNADKWSGNIMNFLNKLLSKIPFLRTFGSEEEMLQSFGNMAKDMFSGFTSNIPEMLTHTITLIPNLLFVSLVLIMASYYFCADYEEINSFVMGKLPEKAKVHITKTRVKLKLAGKRILKGYLLTIGITFLQLYAGLAILRTDYAFTVALIIALLDVLPVIGVGTVLIPWAVIKLVAGAYYEGFGLLIIFAVVSVVREILEPKIIGKSIGLHPLMTLFSMYIGLNLCGFLGMISFPVLVIVLKTLLSSDKKEEKT